MNRMYITPSLILTLAILSIFISTASSAHVVAKSRYTKAHSLGDSYDFDPRDGWMSVNATNLQYKYRRDASDTNNLAARSSLGLKKSKKSSKAQSKAGDPGTGRIMKGVLDIFRGLKGLGQPEPVIITWYTGHDLKNPSCWSNGNWAPTDASFACALTLEGWNGRPQCFQFLELCNGPKKCVFVRVVDTCAGCAAGSKHVDLTRAAFGQLADYNQGTLKVQLRRATKPNTWHDDLWGPEAN